MKFMSFTRLLARANKLRPSLDDAQLVGDYHPIEDLHDLQIILQLYQRLAEAYRETEDFE